MDNCVDTNSLLTRTFSVAIILRDCLSWLTSIASVPTPAPSLLPDFAIDEESSSLPEPHYVPRDASFSVSSLSRES